MTIDRFCPNNCKYIDNGKCIATECNHKLGEYENDAKGSQRRSTSNIKEGTMYCHVDANNKCSQ